MPETLSDSVIENFKKTFSGKVFRDKKTGWRYEIVGLEEGTDRYQLKLKQLDYRNEDGFWPLEPGILQRLEEID